MGSGVTTSRHRFHELPLVFFSALGIAGGGVGLANLLRVVFSGGGLALSRTEALVLVGLLLGGAILSTGHLGQPQRSPLVLRRLFRSPLSDEILALGVVLGGGSVALFLPPGHPFQPAVGLIVSLGSIAFLVALGKGPGGGLWPSIPLSSARLGACWLGSDSRVSRLMEPPSGYSG